MAYISGAREFWSLPFRTTAAALIPRPDSETLIAQALAGHPDRAQPLRLLDLGTGSGCLLVTLLHLYRRATGLGVDRSPDALNLARCNAEGLGVADRAAFVAGDWARAIDGRFNLVVANPPYVADADLARLPAGIVRWEPRLALAGGADGLDAYRAFLPDLLRLLAPGASALIEIGSGQADAVAALANRAGLSCVEVSQDLAGIGRCLRLIAADRRMRKKALGNQVVPGYCRNSDVDVA